MPGIVGLATAQPRERAESALRCMVECLRHEPFYASGSWLDESLGIYVGWCERGDGATACMPRQSRDGGVVLVFSGEEYAASPPPRQASDGDGGDALVRLYEEDPTFPAALNGRFHGLLADRRQRTVTLFNDRYGIHRLYVHQSRDGFYFATEAKAILAVCPELGRLDTQALGELLSCGCVLEHRTLFDGIEVLPGAARWTLRGGRVEHRATYFQPREWESQPALEPDAYYRALRETFAGILPRYFDGPEPIAMSLTGGLDTRMIMAWQRPAPGSLPCYTFASMWRDSRDVRLARQVASACGLSHRTIRVGEEFLARFPAYAERTVYLTDGCADVSRAADLYVNEEARRIAPVRMTGNYGSEVLRENLAFKPAAPPSDLFSADFLPELRRAERTYAILLRTHPLSFALFRQLPWHHYGLLALEESQLSLRSPYLDNDLVRTVFRAPPGAGSGDAICLRLIADGSEALRRLPTDRGSGGDGIAGAAARALLQLQFKAEYAYDTGMPQWLAPIDRALAPLRPERLFLGRHKFCHFRLWYRDVLAGYVREVLLDPSTLTLPWLSAGAVEAMVSDHLAGRRNHTLAIHRLLTAALVQRLFAQPSAGAAARSHRPTA